MVKINKKINKKGDESVDRAISQPFFIIIAIILVIALIIALEPVIKDLFNLNSAKETKNSFKQLTITIEKTLETQNMEISLFSMEKGYALVLFKKDEQKKGDYVAPPECQLLNCLVVCESKECSVIDLKQYGNEYEIENIETNVADDVIIPSSKEGFYMLYVKYDKTSKKLVIYRENEQIKKLYEDSLKK